MAIQALPLNSAVLDSIHHSQRAIDKWMGVAASRGIIGGKGNEFRHWMRLFCVMVCTDPAPVEGGLNVDQKEKVGSKERRGSPQGRLVETDESAVGTMCG